MRKWGEAIQGLAFLLYLAAIFSVLIYSLFFAPRVADYGIDPDPEEQGPPRAARPY